MSLSYSYLKQMDSLVECEDELRKLCVGKLELASYFYANHNQLQVNVREVHLNNFSDSLHDNAFIYFVLSLHSTCKTLNTPCFESELRPIAIENYFDETSEFEVTTEDILSVSIKVSVYASDRFSQHRLVNEFTYSLRLLDEFADKETKPSILPLVVEEISRSEDDMLPEECSEGELLFSMCYMPTSGRLTFVALKGRNISERREVQLGTYLRVSLMVAGKTMKTVQTTNAQKSASPVYNEAFVFHAPLERIKDTDIVVSVCSHDELKNPSPKMLGKVIVGPVSGTNLGRKHWEAMLSAPRRPVAQWHGISRFL